MRHHSDGHPRPLPDPERRRRLIREEVFDHLFDAIVSGDRAPGEQLDVDEVKRQLGVSRTPVRDALQQLSTMGLVEIVPQTLTRVAPIEPVRLAGLFDMVGVLLRGAVRDATPLLTAADEDTLRGLPKRAAQAQTARERDRVLTDALVGVFVRRLGNGTLERLIGRHLPEVRRALIAAPTSASFVSSVPALERLVTAAAAGEAGHASEAFADFWGNGLAMVVDEFPGIPHPSGAQKEFA